MSDARPECSRTTCDHPAAYRYDWGPYHSVLCPDHADAKWAADPTLRDGFEPLPDAGARLDDDHDVEVSIRYRGTSTDTEASDV